MMDKEEIRGDVFCVVVENRRNSRSGGTSQFCYLLIGEFAFLYSLNDLVSQVSPELNFSLSSGQESQDFCKFSCILCNDYATIMRRLIELRSFNVFLVSFFYFPTRIYKQKQLTCRKSS